MNNKDQHKYVKLIFARVRGWSVAVMHARTWLGSARIDDGWAEMEARIELCTPAHRGRDSGTHTFVCSRVEASAAARPPVEVLCIEVVPAVPALEA